MRLMFRNMLVAIVAVLALSAVASATASAALPEIVNSKGEALVKKKFTGEVTERMIDEINGRGAEECQKLAFAGEIKGTKGGEGTLTLHCAGSCHTKGLKEKEMKFSVSVNLVWLNKAKEEAALLLSIPGVADVEDYCWSNPMPSQFPLEVSGSLLVPVSTKTNWARNIAFCLNRKSGKQEPSEYENEAGEKVKAQLETTASLYTIGKIYPWDCKTRSR